MRRHTSTFVQNEMVIGCVLGFHNPLICCPKSICTLPWLTTVYKLVIVVKKGLSRTAESPTFDPITNDLIRPGRLYTISDLRLRKKLSSWSSNLILVTGEETSWLGFNRNVYMPFLCLHYSTRNINHAKWSGLDVMQTILLNKEKSHAWSIGRSKTQADLNGLFSQPLLESHLSSVISTNLFANEQSQALRKDITEIPNLLDACLEKQ